MIHIFEREDFVKLARKLDVRVDWHEPDEQDVKATLVNGRFDNAGNDDEAHVIISQGNRWYKINLADLCAFASASPRS